MPTIDRVYFTNEGRKSSKYLDASAIPYARGSDEYYKYIRDQRNQIEGRTYQKSQELINAEQQLELDKTNPDIEGEVRKQHLRDYNALLATYQTGLNGWNDKLTGEERANDHYGQTAEGYQELTDPQTGKVYYQATGNPYGAGKATGVGAASPGSSYDNSWNAADGNDVRTDQQKFYDRNLTNFNEQADANGKYSWYGTEAGYDPLQPEKTRTLNLDTLGTRPDASQGAKDAGFFHPADAKWGGQDYWDYNQAQPKEWFDTQIRQRANASPYARAGAGGYY